MVEVAGRVNLVAFFAYKTIGTEIHSKFVKNRALGNRGGWAALAWVYVEFLVAIWCTEVGRGSRGRVYLSRISVSTFGGMHADFLRSRLVFNLRCLAFAASLCVAF